MDPRPDSLGRTDVTRRAFLIGGSAAVALAACGRGSRTGSTASAPPGPLSFNRAFVELAVGDKRLAFAAFRNGKPIPYSSDASGALVATGPSGEVRDRIELDTFPIVRSSGGEDAQQQGGATFCTSRMCGPDVDTVEQVHLERKEEPNFVHVEIYKDRSLEDPSPGTATWSVDKAGEPWVFFISSDGVVRDRLSGPIGDFEVEQGVDRLART